MSVGWGPRAALLATLFFLALVSARGDILRTPGNFTAIFPSEQPSILLSVKDVTLQYGLVLKSVVEVDSQGRTVATKQITSTIWSEVTSSVQAHVAFEDNQYLILRADFAPDQPGAVNYSAVLTRWSYQSEGNSLSLIFQAYSTRMNTTIVTRPDSFVEKAVIQGLSGKSSFVMWFRRDVGASNYANDVVATDETNITVRFPAGASTVTCLTTLQIIDTDKYSDGITTTNRGLRAYYKPQGLGVMLSAENTGSFSINFVGLEEVNSTGDVVQAASFSDLQSRWWGPYNVTDSIVAVSSFGEILLTNSSDFAQVSLETFTYSRRASFHSGGYPIHVNENSFKWNLDVYAWPFQSPNNTLVVRFSIPLGSTDASSELVDNGDGSSTLTISRPPMTHFQLTFLNSAVIDSVPTTVAVASTQTSSEVQVSVVFPSFFIKATYDPVARVSGVPVARQVAIPTEKFVAHFLKDGQINLVISIPNTSLSYTLSPGVIQEIDDEGFLVSELPMSNEDGYWSDPVTTDSGEIFINITLSSGIPVTCYGEFYFNPNTSSIRWTLFIRGWSFSDPTNRLRLTSDLTSTQAVSSSTTTNGSALASASLFGDLGEHTFTMNFVPNAILDGVPSSVNISLVAPSTLSLVLNSFSTEASYGSLTAQVSDTRNGGGCRTTREMTTPTVQYTFDAQNARISITPTRRNDLTYTFDLLDISEQTPAGETVTSVPSIWWSSDCFGPYNVTVDIQYVRAQYAFLVPGSAVPATIDFNGFLHQEPTFVEYQGEEIAIDDDTLKFDLDIKNWPFKDTANFLVLHYRVSSNKDNAVESSLTTAQKRITFVGDKGHDSLLYLFPSSAEIDDVRTAVGVSTSPALDGAGNDVYLSFPYFQRRVFYDPTLEVHHTVPDLSNSTEDLAVTWYANSVGLNLTHPEFLTVQDYSFQLIDITEITGGRDPVVVQTLDRSNIKGGWYEQPYTLLKVINFIGFGELQDDKEVSLEFNSELYTIGTVLPYGDDTVETLDNSLRLSINAQGWPFASSSNKLQLRFRVTFFNWLTNETELWFHKVGSDRFMDYVVIEGGVHNSRILHIKFPRSSLVDQDNDRLLGSIVVQKVDTGIIDLTFTFPAFEDSLRYDLVFYIGRPNIEWILILVLGVIGFTLIMATYAIVHKLKRYESLP